MASMLKLNLFFKSKSKSKSKLSSLLSNNEDNNDNNIKDKEKSIENNNDDINPSYRFLDPSYYDNNINISESTIISPSSLKKLTFNDIPIIIDNNQSQKIQQDQKDNNEEKEEEKHILTPFELSMLQFQEETSLSSLSLIHQNHQLSASLDHLNDKELLSLIRKRNNDKEKRKRKRRKAKKQLLSPSSTTYHSPSCPLLPLSSLIIDNNNNQQSPLSASSISSTLQSPSTIKLKQDLKLIGLNSKGSKSERSLRVGRRYYIPETVIQETDYNSIHSARRHRDRVPKYIIKSFDMHTSFSRVVKSLHEVNIQRLLSNIKLVDQPGYPYIVRFIEEIPSQNPIKHNLVMEYCSYGDLFDFLIKYHLKMPHSVIIQFMVDIMMGLKFMHNMNVAHGDLKLENVFLKYLEEEGRIVAKLGDFGYSIQVEQYTLTTTPAGTDRYYAPEVFTQKPRHPFKADMWALGVCLYAAFEGKFPFGSDELEVQRNVSKMPPQINEFTVMADSIEFQNLVFELFNTIPESRPLPDDCLNHMFIRNSSKESLKHIPK